MKCVKCGLALDRSMVRADGALECPNCGAVYRRRSASADGAAGSGQNVRAQDPGTAGRRILSDEAASRLRSAADRAEQAARSAGDAVSDLHLGEKLDQAAKAAGRAAADLNIPEKLDRASGAAGGLLSRFLHSAFAPVLLVLILVVAIPIGAYSVLHKSDGGSSGVFSGVFESKDSREIKDLLKRLEKAYNAQDIDALLKLYDPTYTDAMFGMLNLLGLKGDALKSVLPFASQFISQSNLNSGTDFGTIKVKLLDHSVDGSTGSAKYEVTFSYKDGSKDTMTQTADLVKVDDKWYFSYFPSGSSGASDSNAQAAPASIPVRSDLTEADVQGELYYIKGKSSDGKDAWGVINAQGKEIIAPYFADILDYDGSCFAVTLNGKSWGFIDKYGRLVSDYVFKSVEGPDSAGFYRVRKDNSYGLYNPVSGKSVPCQYQDVGKVNENGLFPAKQQDYWGLVDLDGKVRVDFRYQGMGEEVRADRIGAGINRAWGVIDSSGNEIVPLDSGWQEARVSKNGTIFMVETGPAYLAQDPYRVSVFSREGEPLFQGVYDEPVGSTSYQVISEDRFLIRTKSDGYMLIDGSGKVYMNEQQIKSEFPDGEVSMWKLGASDYTVCRVHVSAGMAGINVYHQILDLNGKYVLPEWIVSGYDTTQDNVRVIKIYDNNSRLLVSSSKREVVGDVAYPPEYNWARYYSLPDGRLIREASYAMSNYVTSAPHEYVSALVFQDQISEKVLMTDLDGNILHEYKSFEHNYHGNNNYAFIFDGVYYGVLTDSGFAGKGVAYSKVSYDEDTRTFTLSDGAKQESYRYNPDRSLTQLS